jgi:hypothetical protein
MPKVKKVDNKPVKKVDNPVEQAVPVWKPVRLDHKFCTVRCMVREEGKLHVANFQIVVDKEQQARLASIVPLWTFIKYKYLGKGGVSVNDSKEAKTPGSMDNAQPTEG